MGREAYSKSDLSDVGKSEHSTLVDLGEWNVHAG
jgi:hypothetical protein